MADNLLETLLTKIGIQLPKSAGTATPEQQRLYEEMAQREQGKSGKVLTNIGSLVKGFTVSDPTMSEEDWKKTSGWEQAGMLAAASPFGFPQKGIKGLYSRVEKIAEALPKEIHPNKLGSILRSGASQEEVKWRGLDKLMQEAGNKPLKKEQVVGRLQEKPLDVKVTTRGEPADNPYIEQPDGSTFFKYGTAGYVPDPTRYESYTMPGASNYRETLIQLASDPKKDARLHELRAKRNAITESYEHRPPDDYQFAVNTDPELQAIVPELQELEAIPEFRSYHWDEPNVLVHVRHNERELPPKPEISWNVVRDTDGVGKYHTGQIYHGGPHARNQIASVWPRRSIGEAGAVPTIKGDAQDLTDQLFDRLPPSSKGRMLENIQSDWEQRGAQGGYSNTAAAQTELSAALEDPAVMEAGADLQMRMESVMDQLGLNVAHEGPPRPQDVEGLINQINGLVAETGNGELMQHAADLHTLRAAYDQALDDYANVSDVAVPDMPFKGMSGPPTLALKQQLLDVADRPDLEWIGIAPASELQARGEDISTEFQDVMLPRVLEKLISPFGGKVEKVDLGIKPKMSDPVSILPNVNYAQRSVDLGPYGGLFEPNSVRNTDLNLSGQTQEGLLSFLPGVVPNVDEINALKNQIISQRPNIQSFIARLTPEMKQAIKEKGWPLLLLLMSRQMSEESQ